MRLRSQLSGVVLFLVLACPAVAQESGVHVDPDSPTGKEYMIPIDQARRDASGASTAGRSDGSKDAAPLFGEGISKARGGSSDASGEAGSAGGSTRGTGGAGSSDSTGAQQGSATARKALSASTNPGMSATLQTAGIVVTVVLAGALLGFLLQRMYRRRPS